MTSATPVTPDEDELRHYLKRYLPDYAVPARLTVLDTLPIGASGKLDRARLPPPEEPIEARTDLPRTPLELKVAQIWCAVLHSDAAGLQDNFIDSGGDSSQILDLLTRLAATFSAEISLQQFILSPTMAWLVGRLSRPTTTG